MTIITKNIVQVSVEELLANFTQILKQLQMGKEFQLIKDEQILGHLVPPITQRLRNKQEKRDHLIAFLATQPFAGNENLLDPHKSFKALYHDTPQNLCSPT